MKLAERLDLRLACKRVKEDFRDKCYIDHPYEIVLIETDLYNWLDSLREKIAANEYNPSRTKIIDIPKPNWHLRPGNILTIEDNVIYSALLLDGIEKVKDNIGWSSKTKRFSSILKENQNGSKWFEFELDMWMKFRDESSKLIEQGYTHVLFADISAFFENIDIQRLMYDLESFGIPTDNRELLSKCLNRWAEPKGRGIPQAFRPSNILAEVYSNMIDKRLSYEGITYLRYVDDVRIFCETKMDAVKSLHLLTRLYREKGLNLQTAKSYIKDGKDAIDEINGISDIISELRGKIIKEIQESLELENPYGTPSELRYLIETRKIKVNLIVLIKAFEKYFLSKAAIKFDKSLFHYIINRLGALRNPKAVEYCLDQILTRPQETKFILDYFSNLHSHYSDIAECLAFLLKNKSIIYEYQKILFVKWFWDNKIYSAAVLNAVRSLAGRTDLLQNTKDYCIAYLGKYGDPTDLDLIETFYEVSVNPVSKATIIYSLRKMPKSRRNSIYGRAQGDGYYVDLAIKLARAHS